VYEIRPTTLAECKHLFEQFHAYKGAGKVATYALACVENGRILAAFTWKPPPPGVGEAVCPEAPQGVLALSRMVAIPREERDWHVSRPLRHIMRWRIDRTRWPVLVTYADAAAGHTGHVYRCSGWQATHTATVPVYLNAAGERASRYRNGRINTEGLTRNGSTEITRWEHWTCPRGTAAEWMAVNGWRRETRPGVWRSGNPRGAWVRVVSSAP